MLALSLLLVPLITGLVTLLIKDKKTVKRVGLLASAVTFLISLVITYRVMSGGAVRLWNGLIYLDSLSIYIIDIGCFIALLVSIYSLSNISYYGYVQLLIATMILTCISDDMGILWLGLGFSIPIMVILIALESSQKAVEASWKAIIIPTAGIIMAFLGTVIMYYAAKSVNLAGLDWTFFMEHGKELPPGPMKLSFILLLLGYAIRAGLFPGHTWLPDVLSQGTAPVSAFISTVFLNTSIYGIIRVSTVARMSLGEVFTGRLLMACGLTSLVLAAILLLTQKDYNRLLAYSTIEHMGLVILGVGTGSSVAIIGSLLHILFHSLGKALLFFSSGNVYYKYGTGRTDSVRGLFTVAPITSWGILVGLLCAVGLPVSISESNILSGVFEMESFGAHIITLIASSLAFAGMILAVIPTLWGQAPANISKGETSKWSSLVILTLIVLIVILGTHIPGQLKDLVHMSVELLEVTLV